MLAEVAGFLWCSDAAAIAQAGRALIEALPVALRRIGAVKSWWRFRASQVCASSPDVAGGGRGKPQAKRSPTISIATRRFAPDQLYFDAAVIGRDLAKGDHRRLGRRVARRRSTQARRHAEPWGARWSASTPETPHDRLRPPADLEMVEAQPAAARASGPTPRCGGGWQFWLPVALLAVVALVAVVLPLWQKRDFAIALTQITEQARVQAAASDALRQQLDQPPAITTSRSARNMLTRARCSCSTT